ncbi:MAG: LuxR C-terminal-related transcriptional regulator [Acidobacteriota bacterium]
MSGPERRGSGVTQASRELERGRELSRRRAWADAYRSLSKADEAQPLGGDDLFLLAICAGLLGRDEDFVRLLERAHRAFLEAGESERAARAAFWLGMRLGSLGEKARASGWFARSKRLLERNGRDCVERGYLLLPAAREHLIAGQPEAAYDAASEAVGFGERFGDRDLVAFARNLQGEALLRQGQVDRGLALLDEAMVSVTAGEVSTLITGLIYCSVIQCCQRVYALGRAREWTNALADWCAAQPGITFTGYCLVHRSEILQLNGAWPEAIEEARRAAERISEKADSRAAAAALYQQAEVHRLRGEFGLAEEAYRAASRRGLEPQPGLALLRMAQGRTQTAVSQIRRLLGATADRLQRARLLPACVEILLEAGEVAEARRASRELDETAESLNAEVLNAMAAHARGAVELAEGDAQGALAHLRRSLEGWRRVGAPYIEARLRVLVGLACRALGDEEGARLELDAARGVFDELGAAPDLARLDGLAKGAPSARPHGLTPRELQVLRLVAAGKTNKAIAADLFLSEKTVDRHISNIFAKLDVSSRAAATAFAYEHGLL